MLAYNLGSLLRRLILPTEMVRWSLTALREKLVRIGARLVRHAHRLKPRPHYRPLAASFILSHPAVHHV